MKPFRPLLLLCIPVLLLGCCRSRIVRPELRTLVFDTVLQAGECRCQVHYSFQTVANADRSPALRAIEESNIAWFYLMDGFTGDAASAARESADRIGEQFAIEGGRGAAPYEATVQCESSAEVVDTLLVVGMTRYVYGGGAHGMQRIEWHNYSLAGGYELTLEELFRPSQRQALAELAVEKLCQRYGAERPQELADHGFFPEMIGLPENFRLTREGIVLTYNPYEIGCHALGTVEVPIGRAEIEGLR